MGELLLVYPHFFVSLKYLMLAHRIAVGIWLSISNLDIPIPLENLAIYTDVIYSDLNNTDHYRMRPPVGRVQLVYKWLNSMVYGRYLVGGLEQFL